MKAKNRIMLISLLFIGVVMYIGFISPVSAANTSITSNMTNSEIQSALNSASPGDTINFVGSLYENLQLTINKTLNIVSSVGTKLFGSDHDSAVFLINGPQASGTTISGFTINAAGTGIIANNTSNVNILKSNITANNGTAVLINGSSNTTLKDDSMTNSETGINISNSKNTQIAGSVIKGNQKGAEVENSASTSINNDQIINNKKRGIGIYNSNGTTVNGSSMKNNRNNSSTVMDEGGIYAEGSNSIKISGSQVSGNFFGVSTTNVSNVNLKNSTISDNYADGILLKGYAKNVTVENNTIQRNANGIRIDYTNDSGNITIQSNIIADSKKNTINIQDPFTTYRTGYGITCGFDYKGAVNESIKHNVIVNNAIMEMYGMDASSTFGEGQIKVDSNVYGYVWSGTNPHGASIPICCRFSTTSSLLHLVRTGENTYAVYFTDGDTGDLITDLPSIGVTFTVDGTSKTVMTKNGIATFQIPAANFTGNISASYIAMNASISLKSEITPFNSKGTATIPLVTAKPAGGFYNTSQKVTLTASKNATMYYTLDSSTPTAASTKYTGLINITSTHTLKVLAVDNSGNMSSIYTANYVIDTKAPTASASVKNGVYKNNKSVILKISEDGTIYYTLNGRTPTKTSSKYTGPINITSTHTLKFIAVDKAGNMSPVYTVKYTIDKTAPKIVSITPKKGATCVTRTGTITVKFSEGIKSNVNWSKVYIKNLKTGKKVAISKWMKGNTLYIKMALKRYAYNWYQIYIPASAVKDSAGNGLAKGYILNFKTGIK